jgi:hypothetical protein
MKMIFLMTPMVEVNDSEKVDENVCYEFPLRCNENEMTDT